MRGRRVEAAAYFGAGAGGSSAGVHFVAGKSSVHIIIRQLTPALIRWVVAITFCEFFSLV